MLLVLSTTLLSFTLILNIPETLVDQSDRFKSSAYSENPLSKSESKYINCPSSALLSSYTNNANSLIASIRASQYSYPLHSTVFVDINGSVGTLVLNPRTNILYIAYSNNYINYISRINATTNRVMQPIPLNYTHTPIEMVVNPTINKIYVATNEGTVLVIDGSTNKVIKIITQGMPQQSLDTIAVNPVTNMVYTMGLNHEQVIVINGSDYRRNHDNDAIAVDPCTNKVYAIDGNDSIAVINGYTNNVVEGLPTKSL